MDLRADINAKPVTTRLMMEINEVFRRNRGQNKPMPLREKKSKRIAGSGSSHGWVNIFHLAEKVSETEHSVLGIAAG